MLDYPVNISIVNTPPFLNHITVDPIQRSPLQPATTTYYFINFLCVLLHLTSRPNCFFITKFSSKGDHGKIIALLDIFGFESFEVRTVR